MTAQKYNEYSSKILRQEKENNQHALVSTSLLLDSKALHDQDQTGGNLTIIQTAGKQTEERCPAHPKLGALVQVKIQSAFRI